MNMASALVSALCMALSGWAAIVAAGQGNAVLFGILVLLAAVSGWLVVSFAREDTKDEDRHIRLGVGYTTVTTARYGPGAPPPIVEVHGPSYPDDDANE